ncbi:MAG: hypothetical protein FWB73_04865 [Treponema sp.]|nr:hypothetical protein [Treponema sp.]
MKKTRLSVFAAAAFLMVYSLSPLFGADRAPINVNLIIDCSASFTAAKAEITTWINGRLDMILKDGDKVIVWSAGASSRIIYTGTINGQSDRDAAKKSVSDLTGAGTSADLSGALRAAANAQSDFSYTLLISASPTALSSLLSGPQSSLMRFSRVEEFSGWRAIVVGLNMDEKIKRAAAAFFQ